MFNIFGKAAGKASLPACCMLLLTSCFQVEGVHIVHHYGDSDDGAYRVALPSLMWTLSSAEDRQKVLDPLRRFSNPSIRYQGDRVYLEDLSGSASMEHFYDSRNCHQASGEPSAMDCSYQYVVPQDLARMAGWKVSWDVVLEPGMRVLSGNHHRVRYQNGRERLVWYFDGNQVSQASVAFSVRVRRLPN